MTARVRLAEWLRPVFQSLPRGYGPIYKAVRGADANWAQMPNYARVHYDRKLQAYVFADLRHEIGRQHYFLGKYFDDTHPLVIQRFLKAGDTYIDIGANIGMHTLCGSRTVGPTGRVFTFEPNPRCFEILKSHLVINQIRNCKAFQVALSDSDGELPLSAPHDSPSMVSWSLRSIDTATDFVIVPVRVGDDMIKADEVTGRVLIKIDTEGFEHHVLRGLRKLLEYSDLLVYVEVTDAWMKQSGTSAAALFEDMRAWGYRPHLPRTSYNVLGRPKLDIERLDGPLEERRYDVLFARNDLVG